MVKKFGLFGVALIVFVVVLAALASTALADYDYVNHVADKSAVVNSVHDVTRNLQGANPCENCHIPHGAKGDFLWARDPSISGAGASDVTSNDDTGVSSAIKPMCYSCHDGDIASLGLATVFSGSHSNHRTRAATALRTSGSSAGQPYGPGRDCDLCHDPHDDGNTDFLKYERLSRGTWKQIASGGNFCASCHSGNAGEMNHPTDVAVSAGTTPLDNTWVPAINDYSGTRLYLESGVPSSSTGTLVMCGSCHTPHGAIPNAIHSSGDFQHLNTMDGTAGALCLNCNQ